MIFDFVGQFIAGWYGPLLGTWLGRYSYGMVSVIAILLGGVIDAALLVGGWMFSGGEFLNSSFQSFDGILSFFIFPSILLILALFLRLLSPLFTWPEAQDVLKKDGYIRQPADEENVVIYEKGHNRFVAHVSRRKDPESIEWWHKGEKRGDVILKRAKGRYVP